MVQRNERVQFAGGTASNLAGIVDLPTDTLRGVAVFTHCFTCNKDLKAIVHISRRLAERGIAVLRYDLTGLGSSRGDFSQTNFTTNRADLRAAVEFISGHLAPPDLLIGHSFGAACSLSMAQEIPSVQAVVSLAGPSDTQHLATVLERMSAELKQTGTGVVHIGGRDYVIHQQMLDDFRSHDLSVHLRALAKPTLLFHSLKDQTLGYEHVLRLFGLLSNRDVQDGASAPTSLITLPDSDHLLTNNADDTAFIADCIATWYERHQTA